ncbi:MAG TPA: M1 family aminopeptidase [Bryobacteraceae bacterium]|nr:M1 family aminopeptidase [Bryobacteraceae bacterium]
MRPAPGLAGVFLILLAPACASAGEGLDLYQALRSFPLTGGSAVAENLVLKRDRAEMTFDGTFYFAAPVAGKVRGAVFLGRGSFRADPPPVEFERANLRRLLDADRVESDFKTAVLRFTDDTFAEVGRLAKTGPAPPEAQKLASELDNLLLKQTGANLSARVAASVLNGERPGLFVAHFDKGSRAPFTLLLDPQGRIPTDVFGLNAGEKLLVFQHESGVDRNDVWLAARSAAEYTGGPLEDGQDLVAVRQYAMTIDLTHPKKHLGVVARLDCDVLAPGIRAVPFVLNDTLEEFDSERLKKAMRLNSVRLADGGALEAVQEDWDSGITVFLPAAADAGAQLSLVFDLEGDFMEEPGAPSRRAESGGTLSFQNSEISYPRSSFSWYPRHGYMSRSRFQMTFRHPKGFSVVATGTRVREEGETTEWKIDVPVTAASFGIGRFARHSGRTEGTGVPIELYSPQSVGDKQSFMLTELSNCIQFFSTLFGKYPYPSLQVMQHTRGYGQGLPTMLLLPPQGGGYSIVLDVPFIAHEMSHQWWGDLVTWRTYRDQWLSEGFADYSGILYLGLRMNADAEQDRLRRFRRDLRSPPATEQGPGSGRLVDIGPLILGLRLNTRKTLGAYNRLIYEKGALVLRMLHYLMSDPSTGDDKPFYAMMADFVRRHQNGAATTESFAAVASEHFARSALAKRFGLHDLDWFFRQWVYGTALPSYRLEYALEDQSDGTTLLQGTLYQDGAPADWFMPVPVAIRFAKARWALASFGVRGPQSPVRLKLPMRPESVELDPHQWVLSESTTARAAGK